MTQDNPISKRYSGTGWQNIGELELLVCSQERVVVDAWLIQILEPYTLPDTFMSKIMISANHAVLRAFESESKSKECQHIHFRLYAPGNYNPSGLNWGFFRIEKEGDFSMNGAPSAHIIEFYLYCDLFTDPKWAELLADPQ